MRIGMERLTEAVAEIDDDLATKYLEGEEITSAEIVEGVKQGMHDRTLVPILAGAPLKELGVSELLDFVVDYLPSPAEVAPAEASDETALPCDSDGPLAALVFKTAADPFVGKLSYFRVYSGTFAGDTQLLNATRGEAERVGQVFEVRGRQQDAVPELSAGDIGAVTKLTSVVPSTLRARRSRAPRSSRV